MPQTMKWFLREAMERSMRCLSRSLRNSTFRMKRPTSAAKYANVLSPRMMYTIMKAIKASEFGPTATSRDPRVESVMNARYSDSIQLDPRSQ